MRLPAALALVPPLSALVLILLFQVDVPVHDQWDLVPQMVPWSRGDPGLEQVWAPYGEHRMFLPRLLMLSMGVVSGWWIPLESLASILFLGGTAALLARVVALQRSLERSRRWWTIALVSLLALAPNRAEAYMWSWQLQVSMALFFAVLALVLLGKSRVIPWLSIPAGLSALAASLCFGAALAVWPVGLLRLRRGGRKPLIPAAWLAPATVALLLYLGPAADSASPGLTADAISMAGYSAVFLGAPLLTYAHRIQTVGLPIAGILGIGGVVLLLFLYRSATAEWKDLWLALGLMAVFSAVLTAGGRAGFGARQALSLRYVPFSSLLWISVAVLLLRGNRGPTFQVGSSLLGFLVVMTLLSSAHGVYYAAQRHRRLQPVPRMLREGRWEEASDRLHLDPERLRRAAGALRDFSLSVYRGWKSNAAGAFPEGRDKNRRCSYAVGIGNSGKVAGCS
ncbi:hypothetical protein GF402_00425 [Candidatus Fermentibacteria bacterium]|nr:hypothetical protein [Candidatus Fermentibacteria bacterium]